MGKGMWKEKGSVRKQNINKLKDEIISSHKKYYKKMKFQVIQGGMN